MPKVMHVAKARQRYETKPVIDPETGEQKVVTTSRATRKGKEVTRRLSEPDLDRPLPPRTCDYDGKEIAVGTPFKYIAIKRQHGGTARYRHEACPNWNPWEYSDALWARIAQIQAQRIDVSEILNEEDAQGVADGLVEMITMLAEEKREAAQNMEDGFGHSTAQSEEIADQADQLDSWANEFSSIAFPEPPSTEETCTDCGGSGQQVVDGVEMLCPACEDDRIEREPTDDEMAEWRDEVQNEIASLLENSPL
jgi:hypothetical protein